MDRHRSYFLEFDFIGVFARFTTAAVDAKDNIQGIVFKFYADTFYFTTGPDGELDRSAWYDHSGDPTLAA